MTIQTLQEEIENIPDYSIYGSIHTVQGLLAVAPVPVDFVKIGTRCLIRSSDKNVIPGEVVGFSRGEAQIMGYKSIEGVGPGCRVDYLTQSMEIFPTAGWCGRVLNGLGEAVDQKGILPQGSTPILIRQSPPSAHARQKVGGRIDVGVRAINTFLTCCQGQRLGIFAGSGVGKSMLLSMLARFTACDVCVIGLIGERGREVRDFIEDTLGEEGLQKSVLIVATSDESPLMRRQAAYTTMAVAEYFRDQGKSVLCLMDSVTRLAMAQREIGLSAGEPPTTRKDLLSPVKPS
jgi:flagellum-specific ATP synthase